MSITEEGMCPTLREALEQKNSALRTELDAAILRAESAEKALFWANDALRACDSEMNYWGGVPKNEDGVELEPFQRVRHVCATLEAAANALTPFASFAEAYDCFKTGNPLAPDGTKVVDTVTIGDFRAAEDVRKKLTP